jgi:DNA primase
VKTVAESNSSSFDVIRNAVDIVDVISEYVRLQPAGKNYKGLCPFHQEKTPSFTVSKERQFFHCFGCGERGNVFQFVQKIKNVSFLDAVKQLADRYNLPFERKDGYGPSSDFERLAGANAAALDFYKLSLTNLEAGRPALQYLKQRDLTLDLIRYFQIGFAPDRPDALYQAVKAVTNEFDLIELGLIRKTETAYSDVFRNRIMFPITNEAGRIVGFSGRIYQESNRPEPKYVNTAQTKLFVKGEILYNLSNVLTAIRQKGRVFLYEGFMDVIASHRAGISEAVASMGTALTPSQARLIRKYTEKVVLCYDGDRAGFEAMNKAIHLLEEAQLEVSLLLLPEGLDPDEYLKKYGVDRLRTILEDTQIDPWEFRYQYLKRKADLTKSGSIERFKTAFFRELHRMASDTITSFYLRKMAADLVVDPESVASDFRHMQLSEAIEMRRRGDKLEREKQNVLIPSKFGRAEKTALNYFLESFLFREILLREFSVSFCHESLHLQAVYAAMELIERKQDDRLRENVIKTFSKQDQSALQSRMLPQDYEYTMQELDDIIFTLKERAVDMKLKAIADELAQLDPITHKQLYLEKQQERILLRKRKEELIQWKNRKSSTNS